MQHNPLNLSIQDPGNSNTLPSSDTDESIRDISMQMDSAALSDEVRLNNQPTTEFVELISQYDVLCVSETKLDNADVISVQGYTFYSQPRKQKYIRKSGGLGFFVQDNLTKFITILESTSEYIAWLKISNRLQSLKADIQIGAVYIPHQSRFFNEDEHEYLEHEVTSACGSDNYVCILDDFNAQTADLEDLTKNDTFLSEHFHFDQQTDDFFDQNCALEKYNLNLKRLSKDKKKNNSGFRLIDMCKNNNLTILNGRYGHDKQIGAMTFRDTSVIDYALASSDTFEILLDFEVVEVDRLFSAF